MFELIQGNENKKGSKSPINQRLRVFLSNRTKNVYFDPVAVQNAGRFV
jgi:hypothetical protein